MIIGILFLLVVEFIFLKIVLSRGLRLPSPPDHLSGGDALFSGGRAGVTFVLTLTLKVVHVLL